MVVVVQKLVDATRGGRGWNAQGTTEVINMVIICDTTTTTTSSTSSCSTSFA